MFRDTETQPTLLLFGYTRTMTRYVTLYIPGVGDRRQELNWLQSSFLATWRLYGFSARLFVMDWKSTRSFDDRFDELLELIDRLHAEGREVSLVGASAGAATVLLALRERSKVLQGIVTICGQIGGTAALHGGAAQQNPRFGTSFAALREMVPTMSSELRGRVLTLRPRHDRIVPVREAMLDGATNYQMPISGHMAGIGFGLLIEGYRIARFLKSRSAS